METMIIIIIMSYLSLCKGQGQAANILYGQSFDNNFICITPTSERSLCAGSGSTGPTGFSPMIGVTFGPTGQLIAASPMENRVLMYPTPNGLNTNTGPNAVVSFGSTLTTSGAGNNPSASTLLSPQGVTFDQARDRLYIADSGWNRVLQFAPTGGDALKVWGQANFATGACNAGARVPDSSTLCNPSTTAISSDGSILFVVDRGNHRVVGYVGSNTQATILIGQALFSDSQPNRGFTSIAQGLDGPNDIALDSQNNVYIADTNNNRTVIYTFGQWDVPSGVIGQTSINTTSGTQLSRPTSVRLYNGAPYIADAGNCRIVRYDAASDTLVSVAGASTTGACFALPSSTNLGAGGGLSLAIDNAGNIAVGQRDFNRVSQFGVAPIFSFASILGLPIINGSVFVPASETWTLDLNVTIQGNLILSGTLTLPADFLYLTVDGTFDVLPGSQLTVGLENSVIVGGSCHIGCSGTSLQVLVPVTLPILPISLTYIVITFPTGFGPTCPPATSNATVLTARSSLVARQGQTFNVASCGTVSPPQSEVTQSALSVTVAVQSNGACDVPTDGGGGGGLSAGALAGIIIGSIVGALIIVVAIVGSIVHKKRVNDGLQKQMALIAKRKEAQSHADL